MIACQVTLDVVRPHARHSLIHLLQWHHFCQYPTCQNDHKDTKIGTQKDVYIYIYIYIHEKIRFGHVFSRRGSNLGILKNMNFIHWKKRSRWEPSEHCMLNLCPITWGSISGLRNLKGITSIKEASRCPTKTDRTKLWTCYQSWESKGILRVPQIHPPKMLPPRERRQPSSLPNPPKGWLFSWGETWHFRGGIGYT